MTLFNHTVEYSTELLEDGLGGERIELRKAIIEYDDFWGNRCTHIVAAPADLWTKVKIGGTASAGCPPLAGMVTKVEKGIFRTVWIPSIAGEIICHCLPVDDNLKVGENVLVIECMRHEVGRYGTFQKCIMREIPPGANPNLHSINLLIFNGDDQIAIIHLDPYVVGVANYDDIDINATGGMLIH